MSFTKRLAYGVDARDWAPFYACRLHYRLTERPIGSAQLLIEGPDRFVELLLRDTGAAEIARGRLGEHGLGAYVELDDDDQVDVLIDRVVAEVNKWGTSAGGLA